MFSQISSRLKTWDESIRFGRKDDYELIERIGCGRYGEVFKAVNVTNNKTVAIKCLKPVRNDKILREINVLRRLSGASDVIKLKDIIVNNGIPCLVFPFVADHTLKTLSQNLTETEIRYYMFRLLRAIDFAHKHNIIHRDIKPSNVVIDPNRRILRLVDWGLAEFHSPDNSYSVTVASRHYKSPELLCSYSRYNYSLDIWSFGCVLAGLVFRKEPFFNGLDNLDQLKAICLVLGTKCLRDYVKKYKLNKNGLNYLLETDLKPRQWNSFAISGHESVANDMSFDLIDKLLVFDHKYRLTSDEALCHPFFDSVRNSNKIPIV